MLQTLMEQHSQGRKQEFLKRSETPGNQNVRWGSASIYTAGEEPLIDWAKIHKRTNKDYCTNAKGHKSRYETEEKKLNVVALFPSKTIGSNS